MNKYSWEEQKGLWDKHINRVSSECGIPMGKVLFAKDVLLGAFGENRLINDYNLDKDKPKTLSQILKPRLLNFINHPIDKAVVQLVELATYLSKFKEQEKIKDIITMLLSEDQFEATRLSLAMAFRFKQVGFSNIYLEPDTPRGKGDFKGVFSGIDYLIECSEITEIDYDRQLAEELEQRIVKAIKDQILNVGIEVVFEKEADRKLISDTVSKIKEARHLFDKSTKEETAKGYTFNSQIAHGRVFSMSLEQRRQPPDLKYWDFIQGLSYARPKDTNDVYTIDLDSQTRTGMLFVKGLHSTVKQKPFYERVKDKLETKLSQTHGLPMNTKRLFIFSTELKLKSRDPLKIWGSLSPNIKGRTNIAGVFIVERMDYYLNKKVRFGYNMEFFKSPLGPIDELLGIENRLQQYEISEWITK